MQVSPVEGGQDADATALREDAAAVGPSAIADGSAQVSLMSTAYASGHTHARLRAPTSSHDMMVL